MKLIAACKAFRAVLTGAELVDAGTVERRVQPLEARVRELETEVEAAKSQPDRFADGAVYGLVLLQREGRLVDFLREDVDGYDDAQIGAAVRQIHAGCRRVLADNFGIEPVRGEQENGRIELGNDFDPAAVKLTGNVPNSGPYAGFLRHRGWRAAKVHLPERTAAVDPTVVQPAEVEIPD